MSKNSDTMKTVLFWTAVVFMPGGILLAAYRLGREHRKIKKVMIGLLNKEQKDV